MLSGILGLLGTIFGWLGGLLPDSPLTDYAQVTQDMQLGLAWLNWVVPISEMLVMLVLWMGVIAIVSAVKIALRTTSDIGGKVIGG